MDAVAVIGFRENKDIGLQAMALHQAFEVLALSGPDSHFIGLAELGGGHGKKAVPGEYPHIAPPVPHIGTDCTGLIGHSGHEPGYAFFKAGVQERSVKSLYVNSHDATSAFVFRAV